MFYLPGIPTLPQRTTTGKENVSWLLSAFHALMARDGILIVPRIPLLITNKLSGLPYLGSSIFPRERTSLWPLSSSSREILLDDNPFPLVTDDSDRQVHQGSQMHQATSAAETLADLVLVRNE